MIRIPNIALPSLIQAPVSKSHMQRELMLSVLANSTTRLHGNFVLLPDDVLSAIKCIESFGATVFINQHRIEVIPPLNPIIKDELTVYVGESGFLIRNIVSIGFLFTRKLIIQAHGTLCTRELHLNEELFSQLGLVKCSKEGDWPLILEQINPIQQHLQLDASTTSQIASGVLKFFLRIMVLAMALLAAFINGILILVSVSFTTTFLYFLRKVINSSFSSDNFSKKSSNS